MKVGADSAAVRVDIAHPKATTIAALASVPAPPRPLSLPGRLPGVESHAYAVEVVLTWYRAEDDGDIHLVITSADGASMIAEIPSLDCMPVTSPFRAAAARARAAFLARFDPSERGTSVAVRVHIEGVGFFDVRHRQHGVAPNAVELHPVTRISFTDGAR